MHTLPRIAQLFNLDAYAEDCKCDTDYIPDVLTDEGTSTGWYTMRCMEMQRTLILQTRAAY